MEVLIFAMVIGVIPGLIARSKGRDFLPWYVYGVLLFGIALIHSLLISRNEQSYLNDGMKKCPRCAEMVKPDAKICRYCGGAIVGENNA